MRCYNLLAASPIVTLLVAGTGSAAQAEVTFNNVADTTTTAPGQTTFSSFGIAPSVSTSNVALRGFYSGGTGSGIYTGSVSAPGVAKIVDFSDIAPGQGNFSNFGTPVLSGSNVAFRANYSGGSGIYTGTVGATGAAKVVDTTNTAPGHSVAFTGFSFPSVGGNNVAFSASYSGGLGVYTGTVGATGAAKIVDTTNTAPGHGAFTTFGSAAVSASNVAFQGNYSGGTGIYSGTVGATGSAKIADTGDTAPGHGAFTSFWSPSLSGNTLAFRGDYSGGFAIYTATVGVAGVAEVVDLGDMSPGFGAFTGLGQTPSLSGSNVAFQGFYSGGNGIFLASGGAGGSLSAVLNTGDPLFGSTLASLHLDSTSYDSASNAIGFYYTLADGRKGIGVANIPEPASLGLLVAGALMMLRRQRV